MSFTARRCFPEISIGRRVGSNGEVFPDRFPALVALQPTRRKHIGTGALPKTHSPALNLHRWTSSSGHRLAGYLLIASQAFLRLTGGFLRFGSCQYRGSPDACPASR